MNATQSTNSQPAVDEFDYIVVGAGSAGCVLAMRLSEARDATVLVVEAGGRDTSPWLHVPVGFFKVFRDPRVNWCYETAPVPGAAGRQIYFPRGKVLGGSSAINGLLHVRGQAEDFAHWEQLGNRGWSWDDVLPYFVRSENREAGGALRGRRGPLHVSDVRDRHALSEAFARGAVALGHPLNEDYNGERQDGVFFVQQSMHGGLRWSAARGYLRPAARRRNVRVTSRALVHRIDVEGGRARGITYSREGAVRQARARREVIVAGGSVNSPQLLELSGIGDPERLRSLGIPVVAALSGVGEGLRDHYQVRVSYQVRGALTVNQTSRGWRLGVEGLKYLATRRGLLASSPMHVGVSAGTRPGLASPDVQIGFAPASYDRGRIGELAREPGMTCTCWQHRPESLGHVHALTPDPRDAPEIQPNYLDAAIDRETLVAGLREARRLVNSAELAPWRGAEIEPGAEVESDDEWLDYARGFGSTVFHPVGTCRMGNDEHAVVDERLRVRGLAGLRVVDASVMPTMVSANTHAATVMIAEKAADMIAEDAR